MAGFFNACQLGRGREFCVVSRSLASRIDPPDHCPCHRIAADYLAAFFDETLNGQFSPLLDGSSEPYPEVDLQTR